MTTGCASVAPPPVNLSYARSWALSRGRCNQSVTRPCRGVARGHGDGLLAGQKPACRQAARAGRGGVRASWAILAGLNHTHRRTKPRARKPEPVQLLLNSRDGYRARALTAMGEEGQDR